jgi:hypothetical protein
MARSSTSFRRGQSGNPAGRPRGAWGWKRRLWTLVLPDPQPLVTPAVAKEMVDRALAGHVDAIADLWAALRYRRVDADVDGWGDDDWDG